MFNQKLCEVKIEDVRMLSVSQDIQTPRDEDIDNDILIDEIQQRAPLYKKSLKEYGDVNAKKTLWREVCENIFPHVWDRLPEEQKIIIGK